MNHCKGGLVALVASLMAPLAQAEVRLANIFGDHMVLQRELPIRLWGSARPGEAVRLEFRGQRAATTADAAGAWSVTLKPERAGGPHTLVVRADNELRVEDVLVGEVWVCAGQSNMEWSLAQSQDGAAEVARANLPWLRHIAVPKRLALQAQGDIAATPWQVASPATAGAFSAVGVYFAERIHRELGVPVGLVNMAWGGTHLETWSRPAALATHPDFAELMRAQPATPAEHRARRDTTLQAQMRAWQRDLPPAERDPARWMAPDYNDSAWSVLQAPQVWEEQGLAGFDGVVWYRRTLDLTAEQAAQAAAGATVHLGMIDDCDETWLNGQRLGGVCVWDQPRAYAVAPGLLKAGRNVIAVRVTDTGGAGGFHGAAAAMRLALGTSSLPLAGPWQARIEAPRMASDMGPNDLPGLIYNGMVAPVAGTAMRGVLWYQGESNVGRAAQYAQTFPLLIRDWRQRWGQGEFPFYYVQLASFLPLARNTLAGSDWAELREAQRLTLAVPRTGMAVATDIGDEHDIHPRNKRDVGERLALLALKNEHGRKGIASGPVVRSVAVQGHEVEISFAETGGGLAAYGAAREPGAALQGFAIADASQQFRPASARIVGDKVVVWRADTARPVAVRYGWVDNPAQSNLFNRAGLPASPFRTDDWPLQTRQIRYAP
jgi:sialate O-acetylesterase